MITFGLNDGRKGTGLNPKEKLNPREKKKLNLPFKVNNAQRPAIWVHAPLRYRKDICSPSSNPCRFGPFFVVLMTRHSKNFSLFALCPFPRRCLRHFIRLCIIGLDTSVEDLYACALSD